MNRKDFEALIRRRQWSTLRELFKDMTPKETAEMLLGFEKEDRGRLFEAMPQQMFVAREEMVRMQREEVKRLVERGEWSELRRILSEWPFPDVADLLLEQDKKTRVLLFRSLPKGLAADVFAYLEGETQNGLLAELTDDETRELLADMDPDDRTELLSELPGEATQKLINLLSEEDLREARWLLGYPEESAGRLMSPDYAAVRPHWTCGQALDHIRQQCIETESGNWIYVTDERWHLLDALPLRAFIVADPERRVEEIMDHSFVSVSAFDDREEAVRTIRRYDLEAVPVVDTEGVLVGIVTVDDVLDVAEQEVTEDFHRMAPMTALGVSIRDASVGLLYRKRIGWLLVLVFMNIFSGGGIAFFEDTLEAYIVLAFFLPLLVDSGGNAGSQAATLMVRALATGDVKLTDWFGRVGKEVVVSASMGFTMAFAVSGVALFRGGVDIAVVVAMTMALVVLVGSIIGMSLPFLLTRVGLDPATASAPLITSIADICGILIYFSIATWYLGVA